jgi:hypothetical protein
MVGISTGGELQNQGLEVFWWLEDNDAIKP